ncbi:MAG: PP2C family protein-serine/threonine phosphatase [Gemmatimonadales bacterium]
MQRLERQNTFVSSELASRYEEIDLLYTISEVVGQTVRFEEAAATIVRAVSEVVGARRASIAVRDDHRRTLRTVAAQGFNATLAPEIPLDDPLSVAAQVAREARPQVGVAGERGQPERGYRGEAYMSIPITFRDSSGDSRCLGVINLTDHAGGGRFSAADQKIVAAAANQIGAAIQLSRLVEQEREQQRLRDELTLARNLQRLLMPDPAVLRGDARVAARCIPTEAVGGDFYTFNRLGLGAVAVMVGDVASHGFPAALVMAAVMAAAGIHSGSGASPDVTLRALHDSLGERLSSNDTYLTIFYGILDRPRGRFTWANAGHAHAFRIPAAGQPVRLDATAPPLGLGGTSPVGSLTVEWHPDDLLGLWTDGLVDARSEAGERFGEGRLLALLGEWRTLPPEEILTRALAEVDRFAPRAADDRTLLLLRL